jgi:hypothetical protein
MEKPHSQLPLAHPLPENRVPADLPGAFAPAIASVLMAGQLKLLIAAVAAGLSKDIILDPGHPPPRVHAFHFYSSFRLFFIWGVFFWDDF